MGPSSKADSSEDCAVLFDLERRIEMSIFDSSPAEMSVAPNLRLDGTSRLVANVKPEPWLKVEKP